MSQPRKCFIVSPIGPDGSPIRENSNNVFNKIIKPVTEQFDYIPKRADTNDKIGIITKEIINEIISSDLIIVDLTNLNPNVMYEIGISHTIDKPTILMKNKRDDKNPLPFDTQNHNTIFYDLDNFDDAKKRLKNQIEAIEKDSETYNPIDIMTRSEILSSMFNYFYSIVERIKKTHEYLFDPKNHDDQNYSGYSNYYQERDRALSLQKKSRELVKEALEIQKDLEKQENS